MGKGKKVGCALLVVLLGYIIALPAVWLWIVFAADYFLGNPSSFREYRDTLFRAEFDSYPVKGYVTPSSYLELHAENYTFEAFRLLSQDFTRPVVLRGLFLNSSALKWTPQTLVDHFAQFNRTFLLLKNNSMGNDIHVYDSEWDTLDNIVKNISAGGLNYLQNANFYYPDDMPLFRDLGLEAANMDRRTFLIQFFLGKVSPEEKRVGGSPLHCAAGPNLFLMLRGAKKWTMIDPKYSRYIQPNMFSEQLAAFSQAGIINQGSNPTQRWGVYPRWEGIVYPGDSIWIPGWMWHEVQNVPGEDWSIAVATRYSHLKTLWWNNWLFTVLADLGTPNKPCIRGTRLLCAALHPGFEFAGKLIQPHSLSTGEAGKQMSHIKSLAKKERDFE